MAAPIVTPELQWADANGTPYAGGTITTYALGTTTPKSTWRDPGLTAFNTNPVVLDAAGRSLMYGDGDYRLVLRDAAGNQILDIPATTIVSAAMGPVVSAPTISAALDALGVTALIDAEASARASQDTALANALHDTQVALGDTDTALGDLNTALAATNTALNNEITRAVSTDTSLQNQINAITGLAPTGRLVTMATGTATSDSAGEIHLTFPAAYLLRTTYFEVYAGVTYPNAFFDKTTLTGAGSITTTGAVGTLRDPAVGPLPSQPYTWYATGY